VIPTSEASTLKLSRELKVLLYFLDSRIRGGKKKRKEKEKSNLMKAMHRGDLVHPSAEKNLHQREFLLVEEGSLANLKKGMK
jgi:hypothetical protein